MTAQPQGSTGLPPVTRPASLHLRGRAVGPDAPLVAVPVMGATAEALLASVRALRGQPVDLVEWRLDHLAALPGADLRAGLAELAARVDEAAGGVPVLATYRTRGQGGEGQVTAARYAELVDALAGLPGIDLVDVEHDHPLRDACLAALRRAGTPALVSHHDWCGQPAPEELRELVAQMRATGADAVKLAVTPASPAEALELLGAQHELAASGGPLALIGMGEAGRMTRLVGPAVGGFLTFAQAGRASAPGQLDVRLVAATVGALRHPAP